MRKFWRGRKSEKQLEYGGLSLNMIQIGLDHVELIEIRKKWDCSDIRCRFS